MKLSDSKPKPIAKDSLAEILILGTTKIANADASNTPRLDAELLLSKTLNKSREFIIAHPEKKITKIQRDKFFSFVSRRVDFEPIAYITQTKDFFGNTFFVDHRALIPRAETELLVEKSIEILRQKKKTFGIHRPQLIFADIGTGSGCIAISVAKFCFDFFEKKPPIFFACDNSLSALNVAKKNIHIHNLDRKITLLAGHLASPLLQKTNSAKKFELIIAANLPYLSSKLFNSSPFSVQKHEPRSALFSEHCGLAHYEKLFLQLRDFLTKKNCPITILCEISPEQNNLIKKLAERLLPNPKINFFKDLSGKFRVVKILPFNT